jgi:hypothetical protein
MLREHLPKVTRQVFGRHFKKVNGVATFLSPERPVSLVNSNKSLAPASSRIFSVKVLFELKSFNLATVQGAITGVSGVVGAAVDIPVSLVLVLRTIYPVSLVNSNKSLAPASSRIFSVKVLFELKSFNQLNMKVLNKC